MTQNERLTKMKEIALKALNTGLEHLNNIELEIDSVTDHSFKINRVYRNEHLIGGRTTYNFLSFDFNTFRKSLARGSFFGNDERVAAIKAWNSIVDDLNNLLNDIKKGE